MEKDSRGKKRSGLASLASIGSEGNTFSVIDSLGGVRGVIESMLPGLLFVICFVVTRNVQTTVIVAAVIAVLQVVDLFPLQFALFGCGRVIKLATTT